jgi:hypothetical protein
MANHSHRIARWLELTTWTLFLISVALFLAGVREGFDFTDEGAYYLSFLQPGGVPDSNTSYRFFGAAIFALVGKRIVAMRICTLIATLAGTVIFLNGWEKFLGRFAPALRGGRESSRQRLACALTVSLLGFAISPAALSYNFQNSFCLLAGCGVLLRAAASSRQSSWSEAGALIPLLLFGLLVGLQFFVKFTSGIGLAIVGGAFFLAVSEMPWRRKIAGIALLAGAAMVIALVYFVFFQSFARWWTGISGIAHLVTTGNYTAGQLRRYSHEMASFLMLALHVFLLIWITVGCVGLGLLGLRRRPRAQRVCATVGAGCLGGALVWVEIAWRHEPEMGPAGMTGFFACLLLLIVMVAVSLLARPQSPGETRPADRWRLIFALILLVGIPYLGSFGTSNDINQNCLYQLAPWSAAAGLLLTALDLRWRSIWLHRIGLLILTLLAADQFHSGYWTDPYRVTGSRSEQTVLTEIGEPANQLKLSAGAHDFIETARRSLLAHGFKKGDDLLVFFDLPGLVFALGGNSPRHQWYHAGSKDALDDSAMHLSLLDDARRKRAFIVRNSGDDWNTFRPALQAAGLHFPEDYQLITPPMLSPLTGVPFEIWQPKSDEKP